MFCKTGNFLSATATDWDKKKFEKIKNNREKKKYFKPKNFIVNFHEELYLNLEIVGVIFVSHILKVNQI